MLILTSAFVVLSHENSSWIITRQFQWPRNWIHDSKPIYETLQPHTMWCCLKARYILDFYSRSSNQSLFCTSPRYSSTSKYKDIIRCWFSWINGTSKLHIGVTNALGWGVLFEIENSDLGEVKKGSSRLIQNHEEHPLILQRSEEEWIQLGILAYKTFWCFFTLLVLEAII